MSRTKTAIANSRAAQKACKDILGMTIEEADDYCKAINEAFGVNIYTRLVSANNKSFMATCDAPNNRINITVINATEILSVSGRFPINRYIGGEIIKATVG